MKKTIFFVLVILFFSKNLFSANENAIQNNQKVLNIYSSRKEEFLSDLLVKFSEQNNGVKINVINDSDVYKLIEKIKTIKSSGVKNPLIDPDILITADVASIDRAKSEGILQKSDCTVFDQVKNTFFLDGECFWSAISFRARVIAYSKERLTEFEVLSLRNYFDLTKQVVVGPDEEKATDEEFKDVNTKAWYEYFGFKKQEKIKTIPHKFLFNEKVIYTPISSPYNQFLIAYLLTLSKNNGDVDDWVRSLMEDVAYTKPVGKDTDKLKDIMVGKGDLAMVNSYYFFRMLLDKDGFKNNDFDSKVGIIFPNQDTSGNYDAKGTSINISAVGVIGDGNERKEMAEKFIQFLLSEDAQRIIVANNREYSVTSEVINNDLNSVVTTDNIKFDFDTNLVEIAKNVPKALKIAEDNGWN